MNNQTIELRNQTDLSIFTDTMVELTWPQVKQAAADGAIVLLPIGVIEAHGPHLDLSPDVYLAYLYCRFLKQSLAAKNIQALIAPPFYWGICEDLKNYPGTFSVRPETMKALLIDIFASLRSWGFQTVFIMNSHGDRAHKNVIEQAVTEMNAGGGIQINDLRNLKIAIENPPVFPPDRAGKFKPDYHAGADETADMFTFYPQKVDSQTAKSLKPQNTFHPLGYCGDPASFELEQEVIQYYQASLETDTLKIEAYRNQIK